MTEPYREPPIVNPLPPIVLIVSGIILAIELIFQAGERGLVGGPDAIGWRLAAIREFAFSDVIVSWMVERGTYDFANLSRFVSYAFVQASLMQALFVLVFMVALGKLVAETFGAMAFAIILLVSAIGGALVYTLLLSTGVPLIGGFPAVYGLIGAYTFVLWVGYGATGQDQARAFTLIAMLMAIQLVFGLIGGGVSKDWVADLGGFASGFAVSFLLVPGAMGRIVERLRRR